MWKPKSATLVEEEWKPKSAVLAEPEPFAPVDVSEDFLTRSVLPETELIPREYRIEPKEPMRIGPAPARGYQKPPKPPGWEYASPIEKAVYAFDSSKVNYLLERFGKQFANAFARVGETIISHPLSPIGMRQEEIDAFRAQATEELKATGFRGGPPQAQELIGARAAALAAAKRVPKFKVEPAEELSEKVTDVAAGLTAFVSQLALTKKILPKGTSDAIIWEIQFQATGGIPGQGAAMRLALGGIGKIPVGSLKGKLAKVGLESGLFAGVTAALGGDAEDIIIAGLIPVTFNAWNFAQQRYHITKYEANLKTQVLHKHQQRLKQGMNPATSRAYLRADIRVVDTAVAKAKQAIYRDDAFAPAREKWELQRKKALDMIATGKPDAIKRGNAILDFLTEKPISRARTIEAEIKQIKAAGKAVKKERFKIPTEVTAEAARPGVPAPVMPGKPGAPVIAPLVMSALGLDIKSQKFKEFALTEDGSAMVAAMSPEVAAEIAAKEQPSRNDLKELGISGWNAEERKQLSSLFRDALADQERMTTNQRAVEQLQEAMAFKQREAEQAEERKAEEVTTPEAEITPERRRQAIDYVKGVLQKEQYADLNEEARREIGVKMLAEYGMEVTPDELAVPAAEPAPAVIKEPTPARLPQAEEIGLPAQREKVEKAAKPLPEQEVTAKKEKYTPEEPTTVAKPSIVRVKYDKADIQSATEAVKKTNPNEDRFIYATAEGFVIDKNPPIDKNQSYRVVHPDYSYEDVRPFAVGGEARKSGRRSVLRERVRRGEPTPEPLLREFKGEEWADKAMAKLAPPTPAEPIKEIEYEEEAIIEPVTGLEVEPKKPKKKGLKEKPKAKEPEAKKPKKKGLKEKPGRQERKGVLNVEIFAKASKIIPRTFYRIFEPARLARKKIGREGVAAVMRGTFGKRESAILEFEQKQLEKLDKSIAQLEQELNKYPNEMLENVMLTRGHGLEGDVRKLQVKAFATLPKELKNPDLRRAIDEIADFNYERLQAVAGDDINKVRDYFYGIYKNPKKVTAFLTYWKTTKRFTKQKIFPTYADAKAYGLEIRNPNPVTNLRSEYAAIAQLSAMQWLRDELMRIGEDKYIAKTEKAPYDWEVVGEGLRPEPTFSDVRVQPDLARLINNLISTNKITRVPALNALRYINNILRTFKFIGSAFHLLNIAKQSVADSGYFALYKSTSRKGITIGFRKNDPIFRTLEYKWYIENAGGHRYAVESEARRAFAKMVNQLTKSERIMLKAGGLPFKIPLGFVNWMFQSYIPKVKYSKFLDTVAEQEKKTGKRIMFEDAVKTQEIIKEQQNFYGMMNERLFGRSGTVTTLLRFWFMAPGYAEGNYRTMIKAATQWGFKKGHKAYRSRSNIVNSLMITGILATIGTIIMTGEWPDEPKTIEEMRDLLKIDTGKKDEKGNRIMIDLATYDKDYWNISFNTLRGRPDVAIDESFRRIGGMKAPTSQMLLDLALIAQGKAIYDWKEDRVYHITDPWLQKVLKTTVHEIRRTIPISSSVFKQTKEQTENEVIAAVEAILGLRPARSERDRQEFKIIRDLWDVRDKREKLSYRLDQYDDPQEAITIYNKTIEKIIDSKFATPEIKQKGKELLIDPAQAIKWKRYPVKAMNNKELKTAFGNTKLKSKSSVTGRRAGQPKKGYEDSYKRLKAEMKKRGL